MDAGAAAAALGVKLEEEVGADEVGDETAAVLTVTALCAALDDGVGDDTGTGATEAEAAETTVTGPLTGASPDVPHPASNEQVERAKSNPKCLTAMPDTPSLRQHRRTGKVWTLS